MSELDFIALFFGVVGVILTIYETIWCWPIALISVSIQAYVFYNCRLFGDAALQLFYFFNGIYAWYYWNKKNNQLFNISKITKKEIFILILLTIALSFVFYFILSFFKSDQVIIDSILTASSLICTYMMMKKWIENWILWVLIDLAYVYLYLIKQLPIYALLYLFFSIMAFYGFYVWKKKLKK